VQVVHKYASIPTDGCSNHPRTYRPRTFKPVFRSETKVDELGGAIVFTILFALGLDIVLTHSSKLQSVLRPCKVVFWRGLHAKQGVRHSQVTIDSKLTRCAGSEYYAKDPNLTHKVMEYKMYPNRRMRHFDLTMGSISALILKKKLGMGTKVSKNDEPC